jgi:hypothetical protein
MMSVALLCSMHVTHRGISYTLESPNICDRPGGLGTPCDVKSVLAYWNYSAAAIQADPDIAATVSRPGLVSGLLDVPLAQLLKVVQSFCSLRV